MTDGDPAQAPHVINNSWSCPPGEGCTDPDILRSVVETVRAAGIVTVHAAGNSGSGGCGSIATPAAIYGASFTIGATNESDLIAAFSSRGPAPGEGVTLKPDVTAPGVDIRSSVQGDSYGSLQGTSMAAPHVAGAVALLIAAQPDLAGDVDGLEALLRTTAVPRPAVESCGGIPAGDVPNYTYGYGRIDVWAAYQQLTAVALLPEAYVPVLLHE